MLSDLDKKYYSNGNLVCWNTIKYYNYIVTNIVILTVKWMIEKSRCEPTLKQRYRVSSLALSISTLFHIPFLTWALEELTFQERRARARKNSLREKLREVAATPLKLLRFCAVLRTAPAISGLQSRLIIIGLIWSVAQARDRITRAAVTAITSVRLILRGDTFVRVKDDD